MSQLVTDLIASRDAAHGEYEKVAVAYRDNAAPTDEDTAAYNAARSKVEALDARILEVDADETRQAQVDEVRKRMGIVAAGSPAVVIEEPRTYGPGTHNSYYADLCRAAWPGQPGYSEAVERMARYGKEAVRDAVNDPEQRARLIKKAKEFYRDGDGVRAQRFISDIESRSLEVRAGMDTGSSSGGSFVTPQYLVSDYAPYRTFGRSFINETNLQELPSYGMTVYLPAISAAAGVTSTTTQNTTVTETDPTAGYLSSNLVTEAGQVTISQQLLDRAGPGVEFDKIVFDQLQRAYNTAIDTAVITAALATSGTITDTLTTTTGAAVMQDFYADVAAASSAIENAAGVVMSPTHLFATGLEWSWLTSQVDTTGRPFIVPNAAGPFNAIAAALSGNPAAVPEGATGYQVQSLDVFKDGNIPTKTSNQQIVVAHMPEVWVWEGELIPRTIPQTFAQNLSVLLQVYTYYTVIVRYPLAVQSITGARYPAAPVYSRA